jgi:hypothetical protein
MIRTDHATESRVKGGNGLGFVFFWEEKGFARTKHAETNLD